MVKLQEAENQIITDYEVYDRRPSDASLLTAAIAVHQAKLGRTPRLVAADPGFFSAANEAAATGQGVNASASPSHATKSAGRKREQKKRWFRNGQKCLLRPRDVTPGTTQDNIGGSRYWTTSAELQAPIPGLPPEVALKAAIFADAGSLWGYRGATSFPSLSQSLTVADSQRVRSSIGSSLIWDSPFGPLRVDYAYPTSKASTDVTQRLHFGVGAF
jgi:hypothetical protein